jgi:hypothetical protein
MVAGFDKRPHESSAEKLLVFHVLQWLGVHEYLVTSRLELYQVLHSSTYTLREGSLLR